MVSLPGVVETGAILRVLRAPTDASASSQEDSNFAATQLILTLITHTYTLFSRSTTV